MQEDLTIEVIGFGIKLVEVFAISGKSLALFTNMSFTSIRYNTSAIHQGQKNTNNCPSNAKKLGRKRTVIKTLNMKLLSLLL